jgi:outer membrane murein-binding lipoprotein Lpp
MSRRRILPAAFAAALLATGTRGHEVHQAPETARDLPDRVTTIEQDVAALAGLHLPAKRAAARLAERGEAILPALHAALAAPATSAVQRLQIASVLGEIGDVSSTGPLIALAEAFPAHLGIRQEVLAMLAELPPSPQAAAFATRVLEDPEEPSLVRRKALVFFGVQRDDRGRRFATRHRDDPDPEMRAAALFAAARLGDDSAGDAALAFLREPAPPSVRYALLLALAETATAEEIEVGAPEYLRASWEYRSAVRCARFREADAAGRDSLQPAMLASPSILERKLAAASVIERHGAEALGRLAGPGYPEAVRAAARHQLRASGYRVLREGNGIRLERKVAP